jgi:two-component system, sensor histidine kinase PdtaS
MEKLLLLLPDRPQPFLIRYGVSAIIVLLCCGIQYGTYRFTGFTGLFLLLPGIFACGIVFDRGSGFFATVLGAALSLFLIFPRTVTPEPPVFVPISLFLLTGFAMAVVSEGLRKALERVVKSEREKDLQLRELRHRTKNEIMSIGSILRLQARRTSAGEIADALTAAARRVEVMAEVHDFLRDAPGRVEMDRYLEELCRRLGDSLSGVRPIAIRVEAANVTLRSEKAVPIGIIANELVTNCLKYAFPDDRPGTVVVKLSHDGSIHLVVEDDGVGCPKDARQGSGSVLMQLITRQLGGALRREGHNPGCRVEVDIPKD